MRPRKTSLALLLAAGGPGLLVMLADTDVGNVVTAAQGGVAFGYALLPVPLLLIPLLIVMQELAARLGLVSGKGFAARIGALCGAGWTVVAMLALAIAAIGSLITEFSGIAGVGGLYGVSRWLAVPASVAFLLAAVLGGEYRRVERIAIVVGLFELSFIAVAVAARPDPGAMVRQSLHMPLGDAAFLYLAAGLIGATFNPWMLFYQSSAVARKRLGRAHRRVIWWDTVAGAVVTQVLTASVLVAAAAVLGGRAGPLDTVGDISLAFTPFLGLGVGRLVFSLGAGGAALVAAIVCSLALIWGLDEAAGERGGVRARSIRAIYVASVLGAGLVVLSVPDLVWLSILTQVANAVLLPLVLGLLIWIAARHLPAEVRLRGWWLWVVVAVTVLVGAAGLAGAWAGLA